MLTAAPRSRLGHRRPVPGPVCSVTVTRALRGRVLLRRVRGTARVSLPQLWRRCGLTRTRRPQYWRKCDDGGMPTLRLALAQIDPTVGDLAGNSDLIREWCAKAAAAGAGLVAFPELALTGYPVEDLVFREAFVADSRAALDRLAAALATDGLGDLAVLVGYLDADGPARRSAEADRDAGPRNALAVLHQGQVVARYFKHHLPN